MRHLSGVLVAISAVSLAHAFAPRCFLQLSAGQQQQLTSRLRQVQNTCRQRTACRPSDAYSMMAQRREENVAGNLFVDMSCINCDTCRWMSPCYTLVNGMSAVTKQPEDDDELFEAFQAMAACPTGSIRMERPEPDWQPLVFEALHSFPHPIFEAAEGVYHAGFHSKKSFGATSYFVHREGSPKGNFLVDSPRFFEPLARTIEDMGGAKYMFLTHVDDVADHERWAERLGCTRIIHEAEVGGSSSLQQAEMILEGTGPWQIDDDIKIVFAPGHTEGHTVMVYKEEVAFTGDHLAVTLREGRLAAFRRYTWHSWTEQIRSMEALSREKFTMVLPGHGRRLVTKSYEDMQREMKACIEWMKTKA